MNRFGYLEEKRVKKLTQAEREEMKRDEFRKREEKHEAELLQKDPWKYRIKRNEFSLLRKKFSKFDRAEDMRDWDR